jgi:hypothetical protein
VERSKRETVEGGSVMKRTVLSVMASVMMAGALVAAQSSPAPGAPTPSAPGQSAPGQDPTPAPTPAPGAQAPSPAAAPDQKDSDDTTLKGCLVQGSAPNVYILENAKLATDSSSAKGERYVVEIGAKPEQIQQILNSQVEVSGKAEEKAAAAGAEKKDDKKADESSLPKLTAKRISRVAATCPAAGD